MRVMLRLFDHPEFICDLKLDGFLALAVVCLQEIVSFFSTRQPTWRVN